MRQWRHTPVPTPDNSKFVEFDMLQRSLNWSPQSLLKKQYLWPFRWIKALATDGTSFNETPPLKWLTYIARCRYATEGAKITSWQAPVFQPPSITNVFSVRHIISERLRDRHFFGTRVFSEWEVIDWIRQLQSSSSKSSKEQHTELTCFRKLLSRRTWQRGSLLSLQEPELNPW
jgi:hypothetical protein